MTTSVFGALNRREFLSTTAAAALMAGASMPKIAFGAEKVVKIGFLAPLTGAVAAWGKPGLDGLSDLGRSGQRRMAASRSAATPTRSSSSPTMTNTIPARRAPARSSLSRKTTSSSS